MNSKLLSRHPRAGSHLLLLVLYLTKVIASSGIVSFPRHQTDCAEWPRSRGNANKFMAIMYKRLISSLLLLDFAWLQQAAGFPVELATCIPLMIASTCVHRQGKQALIRLFNFLETPDSKAE